LGLFGSELHESGAGLALSGLNRFTEPAYAFINTTHLSISVPDELIWDALALAGLMPDELMLGQLMLDERCRQSAADNRRSRCDPPI
jgi:hypothetical protein